MRYKMIFLDLDGTLTDSQKRITPYTKQILAEYSSRGGLIVPASGRPAYGVWPTARELGLDRSGGFIIAGNGGLIINCLTGQVLYDRKLTPEELRMLHRTALGLGLHFMAFEGDYALSETTDDPYFLEEIRCSRMYIRTLRDFDREVTHPSIKCIFLGEEELLDQVKPELQEKLGGQYTITRSAPFFIEILPKGVSKGNSVKLLAELTGTPLERTAGFGDAENDIGMLQACGLSVVMGNARDAVKAYADYIAPSNDEDGVAYVVKKMLEDSL